MHICTHARAHTHKHTQTHTYIYIFKVPNIHRTYPLMHMQEAGLGEGLLTVLATVRVGFTDADGKGQLLLTQVKRKWGSNPVFQVGGEWGTGTGIGSAPFRFVLCRPS